MSPDFVRLYMETARTFGQVKNSCKSRQIGVLIVNPTTNNVIGAGYNSPPKGVPHCDDMRYINNYLLPMVNGRPEWREKLEEQFAKEPGRKAINTTKLQEALCHTCPRRLLGLKSGEGAEVCPCAHAEQNAIANKCLPADDAYMFAYCCVPCRDCAKMIINAGISRVYYAEDYVYHRDAVQMFKDANVKLYWYNPLDHKVNQQDLEKMLWTHRG